MGLTISIILAAAGAVLIWAVEASVAGVDVTTLGVILLVVGIAGALVSLVLWSPWAGARRDDERVVRHR
jgi:hypothetical protein